MVALQNQTWLAVQIDLAISPQLEQIDNCIFDLVRSTDLAELDGRAKFAAK